jgi:uncharacterized protein (DUF488 family)
MNAIMAACRPMVSTSLFTIGYEGRTLDEYRKILLDEGVRAVIDVRKNPISRKKGFSKTALSDGLQEEGIAYFHIPSLGIDSSLRQDLQTDEDYKILFDFYSREILPKASEGFGLLIDILNRFTSVALTCFERNPEHCHRHCVAEALQRMNRDKVCVEHL